MNRALILAAIAAVAVGVVATLVLLVSRPAPVVQATEPKVDAELVGALRALDTRLAELERLLAERPLATPPVERTPDGDAKEPSAELEQLATAIDRLTRLLEARPTAAQSPRGPTGLRVPPTGAARSSFPPPDSDAKAFKREHMFRSYQDILDAFGAPDEVYFKNNVGPLVIWNYEADEGSVQFTFSSGLVMKVARY